MRSSTISLPATRFLLPGLGLLLAVLAAMIQLRAPAPLNVGLFPGVAFGIALVLIPWLGPLVLVASVPVQQYHSVALGGASLTATKIALVASLAAFLIQIISRRDSLRFSILFVPYLAWFGAMILSLHGAVDINAGLAELYRWTVALFALIIALYGIRSRRAILATVAAMGFGVIFEGLLGVFQSIRDIGPSSFAVTSSISRAYGTFGKPNTFAAYFELTGPLLGAMAVWSGMTAFRSFRLYQTHRAGGMIASESDRRQLLVFTALSVWFALSAALSLMAIVASFSRGAWLGIGAALIVMLILSDRRAAAVVGILAVIGILGIVAGGSKFLPVALHDRFSQLESQVRIFNSNNVQVTDSNFATVERMAHWQTGLAMFDAHPFTGVGIGNFNARFSQFAVNPRFTISEGHAHNYYINAAAETGIVGLVAYIWLVLTGLWLSIRAVTRSPTQLGRAVGIGAVGVTVALLVHNVVENLHVLNLDIQLAVVWALAIIVRRYIDSESTQSRPPHEMIGA